MNTRFGKIQAKPKKNSTVTRRSAPEPGRSPGGSVKADTPLFVRHALSAPSGVTPTISSPKISASASVNNATALAEIWHAGNKKPFFQKLRMLEVCDPEINRFVEENLYGDDYWLAKNLLTYGPESQWPIHLKVEREMKGWGDSGGKGRVYDILRDADEEERKKNLDLFFTLARCFDLDSDDFWLALNLMDHGPEDNWPLHLQIERLVKGWPGVGGSVGRILDFINNEVPDDPVVFEFLQQLRLEYIAQGKTKSQVATIEEVLHAHYSQIARNQASGERVPSGGVPPSLLTGTKLLSADERQKARLSLTPTGKAIGDFIPAIPGKGTYEARVRQVLIGYIDRLFKMHVVGKGLAEHAIQDNLYPGTKIENIGNLAKNAADAVFQGYRAGKKLDWGDTIADRFETEQKALTGMDPRMKRSKAKDLIADLIRMNETIYQTINKEHNASPSRKAEASILDRIAEALMDDSDGVERLNLLGRGWPALKPKGIDQIQIQRFKASTDTGNQKRLWKTFQYLIHEYMHTLAHKYYNAYADSFGEKSMEWHALIEGVASLLTEIVWSHVNLSELREKVEGPRLAKLPFDQSQVPITAQRYPSYMAAMRLANTVGIQNLYAAYFLGRVDLIGAEHWTGRP